jgi:hypothetical protein
MQGRVLVGKCVDGRALLTCAGICSPAEQRGSGRRGRQAALGVQDRTGVQGGRECRMVAQQRAATAAAAAGEAVLLIHKDKGAGQN